MDLMRIVIGIDFSPASVDAARWAARQFGDEVELILAHAVALPKQQLEDATKRLRDLGDSISAKRVRIDVREGDAARSLSDIALESNADLLIVGARGERADFDRAIGTTAQHAVRESTIPVLIVARPQAGRISHILVPVDDHLTARDSLRWAALLSNRLNARVTILHIETAGMMSQAASPAGSPPGDPQPHEKPGSDNGRNADRWIDLARASGISRDRVTGEEASGVPAVEILSASDRNAADIIVMGRRTGRDLRRAVLGSVTATIVSDPPCSVLVVPAT